MGNERGSFLLNKDVCFVGGRDREKPFLVESGRKGKLFVFGSLEH